MMEKNQKTGENFYQTVAIISVLLRTLIPLALLIGGLFLLFLDLPGWSVIFGIPTVVIGVVFLVYSYDDLVSKRIGGDNIRHGDSEEDDY